MYDVGGQPPRKLQQLTAHKSHYFKEAWLHAMWNIKSSKKAFIAFLFKK